MSLGLSWKGFQVLIPLTVSQKKQYRLVVTVKCVLKTLSSTYLTVSKSNPKDGPSQLQRIQSVLFFVAGLVPGAVFGTHNALGESLFCEQMVMALAVVLIVSFIYKLFSQGPPPRLYPNVQLVLLL